jgi:integrase
MAQKGFIFKKGGSWFLRYRDNVIEGGQVRRKLECKKLAPVCDRYRSEKDLHALRDEILAPINSGKLKAESTLTVAEFAEDYWLPWARENCKPSTVAAYEWLWRTYLAPYLQDISLRDFRTVDAYNLFAEIHRQRKIGRTTLQHCKHRLTGIFTLARNQGALDGPNPIQGAMITKKAAPPAKTHAATPDEVMAILDVLEKAGERKACAAVGLMFFAGLRPGEARGARWEDFDGKRLFVRQSVWHTHTTSPKTEGSEGVVPIIEPLKLLLENLRAADGNPSTGPILRGPSGKPLNLDNLSKRVVIPALQRCEICLKLKTKHNEDAAGKLKQAEHEFKLDESLPKWQGWYSLRRGVATTLAGLTRDGMASKGLLRHANLSTTTRHYVKDVPENTRLAMNLLEGLFNKCSTGAGGQPN